MSSIQNSFIQIKSFLASGKYLFLGTLSVTIPYSIYDLLFGFKGADIGPIWSVILNIFVGLLFTGVIMFFDLLIVRFLFKDRLSNNIYFITGIILTILLIGIFTFG